MDFNISSAELLKGISDVSKAIPAKTTLTILENFLFVLKGDQLEITASDQELTLRTIITVDSSVEDGSMAVPARQMLDLFKALPDQPVNIRTTSESSFECKWSNGNSELPYFPAADFPEIKGTGSEAISISMSAEKLLSGISNTLYATADDEMRPAMTGIFFDITPESTTLVASDAHKLVCYTTTDVQAPQAASFILAKKPANVLKSIVSKDDGEVQVSFDNSTVVFTFGATMLVGRLIVGKFPRYRDVIPQNNSNILRIDRAQLLNTVRRVAVCANKASNHIKFDLKPGQVEITAQDLGFAIAAYEKLDCDYNGAELSIGFKSSFIIDILGNIDCETIVLKFGDSRRAVLIVPSEEEVDTEKVCGILMPVMVS
ncbi:MAG: DNA polymerase III subunit beta [Bacteroidales bacterium]|nr:DNA polymerase III subunit beta [Bacteroidales bacterium]